jgi:perosamine synthetase
MLEDLLVHADTAIRDTLQRLNRNELGIAFVVDGEGRLEGVATDGDIRRGLLAGATLETAIARVMNRTALALPVGSDRQQIFESLTDRIRLIPLLDTDRRVVDYATLARYSAIPVASPSLDGNELAYVVDCLESGWISSQGGYLRKFEAAFADFLGVEQALAVSNGTVALHLALVALGIGPGDEVIVPDLTFAASASSVIHAGATPVLVDVDRSSWTIDLDKAAAAIGPRTRAIMPVHLYGQPADMDGVRTLAERHRLLVIEDAAEALGSTWKGRRVGSFGDAATFSFFANKIVTTGEGGMAVFADPTVAERARRLRDHGMNPNRRYWHDEVGFNYRMTNMQAAIGLAQMERIESFIASKLRLAEHYSAALAEAPGVVLPAVRADVVNTFWAYSILLSECPSMEERDRVIARLARLGIGTRPLFYPLHVMPAFRAFAGNRDFATTDYLSARGLSLPSAVSLTEREIDFVGQSLRSLLAAKNLLIAEAAGPATQPQ